MIDDIDCTVRNIFDYYLKYGEVIGNKVDLIRSLEFDRLKEIYKMIDFNNKAVVIMKECK